MMPALEMSTHLTWIEQGRVYTVGGQPLPPGHIVDTPAFRVLSHEAAYSSGLTVHFEMSGNVVPYNCEWKRLHLQICRHRA